MLSKAIEVKSSVQASYLFIVMLFCSIYKPMIGWGGVSIFMVVLTMAILFFSLLFQLHKGAGFVATFQTFKVELLLCLLYVCVCLCSLVINSWRYSSLADFIFYGLSPIAIWCCFPLSLLLFHQFRYSANRHQPIFREWPIWVVLLLLAAIGIWQATDFFAVKPLILHFVSADVSASGYLITSLFRTNTDFGPVMAYSSITALSIILYQRDLSRGMLIVLALAAVIFIVAGFLCSSKNFILMLVIASTILFFPFFKKRLVLSLTMISIIIASVHGIVLSNKLATARIATVFPYIQKLKDGNDIALHDFAPNLSSGSIQERKRLWGEAIGLWQSNKLLGISAGGFKLSNEQNQRIHATHNVFIQALTEGGLIGLVVLLTLLIRLAWKRVSKAQIAIVAALLANLQFDYYLDHSLPWILAVSWLLVRCGQIDSKVAQKHTILLNNIDGQKSKIVE